MSKPTFENACGGALLELCSASDRLRSNWRTKTGLTRDQAAALQEARAHIERAKAALERVAYWTGGAR